MDIAEALFLGSVISATVPAPNDRTLAASNPWTILKINKAARFAGSAASKIFAAMKIRSEII